MKRNKDKQTSIFILKFFENKNNQSICETLWVTNVQISNAINEIIWRNKRTFIRLYREHWFLDEWPRIQTKRDMSLKRLLETRWKISSLSHHVPYSSEQYTNGQSVIKKLQDINYDNTYQERISTFIQWNELISHLEIQKQQIDDEINTDPAMKLKLHKLYANENLQYSLFSIYKKRYELDKELAALPIEEIDQERFPINEYYNAYKSNFDYLSNNRKTTKNLGLKINQLKKCQEKLKTIIKRYEEYSALTHEEKDLSNKEYEDKKAHIAEKKWKRENKVAFDTLKNEKKETAHVLKQQKFIDTTFSSLLKVVNLNEEQQQKLKI